MSKKIVVISMLLVASIAMAIVPVSVRMRGLGPELVGIVDDEYSDLFFNPAYINRIYGNRVYTNLSNVHNLGEDLLFDPTYSPSMYYNLIGGITNIKENNVGAIIEMGGVEYDTTVESYSASINGSNNNVDSMNYEYNMKNTDVVFNLFWGKKFSNFDIGAWVGPHLLNMHDNEKYTSKHYYYTNPDTIISYTFDQQEMNYEAKTNAYPLMVGIVMGELENEISINFTYGYDRIHGIVPVNFDSSDMFRKIRQLMPSYCDSFDNTHAKTKQGGFYFALEGRNKRRYESHSLSYLARIVFVNQPITVNFSDSSYGYYSPAIGNRKEISTYTTQVSKGPMKHLEFGLGVGAEKYFDAMGAENMFAIGFLPFYFNVNTTIKVEPEKTHSYYYRNYPDTFEYTQDSTSNETVEIKNTTSGFQFTIPVGLETNLTDRLVLRLGATQNLTLKIKDVTEQTLTDGGCTRHYVSGTFDTTYTESANELDSYYSKEETKVSMANSTTYHYGIGYKINDNIELNFLNFADLTNLKKWVLGVNIRF